MPKPADRTAAPLPAPRLPLALRSSLAPRLLLAPLLLTCVPGCFLLAGNPDKANIELRKQNQQLHGQVDSLEKQHQADASALAAWQRRSPTRPTLPPDLLAKLFTVHGLSFGRLTGGAELKPNSAGDDGIKVFVTPTDGAGDPLKAAGSFVVQAVDLQGPEPVLVGRWTFDLAQTRSLWGGSFLSNGYVLTCPLDKRPAHEKLTLHVQFDDELTGAPFEAERQITLHLAPATQPAATAP